MYQDVSNDICRIINDSNVWLSTVVIPDGDQVLDISSAANGPDSSTPVGAKNQPSSFPTGKNASFYRFDSEKYYGLESWPSLKDMLTKSGCVSGCTLSIRHTDSRPTCYRKVTYDLRCTHGFLIRQNGSSIYNGDDVGATNVVIECLKCRKTPRALKGMLMLIHLNFENYLYNTNLFPDFQELIRWRLSQRSSP